MRVAFFADETHGLGHSIRLEALRCEFLRAGHEACRASDSLFPNFLIVDSYDERARMGAVNHRLFDGVRICFIDDYGGPLCGQANIIVNGSAQGDLEYEPVIGQTVFFGPQYCLLRPEFRDLPPHEIRPEVKQILITMGGSPEGYQLGLEIGEQLKQENPHWLIWVVSGRLNASQMVEAYKWGDLAISAGGMSLYECLATGTPTIAIQTADNQKHNIETLGAERGYFVASPFTSRIGDILYWMEILSDPDIRRGFSLRGQRLIDGYGTERVRVAIEKMLKGGGDDVLGSL